MKIIQGNLKNKKNLYKAAAAALQEGKVIIFSTDTIYGILADATNGRALKKIAEIKKRPEGKPLPILIPSIKKAVEYGKISPLQKKELKKYWPGPYTLIFEYKQGLAKNAVAKDKSVALRVPRKEIIKKLLKMMRKPLAATSANLSGEPYNTDPKAIIKIFQNTTPKPDYIFNLGKQAGKPSTIIDLRHDGKKIVRN